MQSGNEKTLRAFLALWATREPGAMATMFAENGVYDNIPYQRLMWGRQEVKELGMV